MRATLIRLRAQIIKELLCLLRDPKSRMVLVGPPLIQLFVFSCAVTLEVRNVDVALLNHDAGGASIELIQQVEASDLVRRIHLAHSETEVARLIDTQQVLAALVIPEDFSRRIAAGGNGTAQIIVDGRKANTGQIALSYLQSIAGNAAMTVRPAPGTNAGTGQYTTFSLGGNSGGWNPNPPTHGQTILCESKSGDARRCTPPWRGQSRLVRQISNSRCEEGATWSSQDGLITVWKGCRGEFAPGVAVGMRSRPGQAGPS